MLYSAHKTARKNRIAGERGELGPVHVPAAERGEEDRDRHLLRASSGEPLGRHFRHRFLHPQHDTGEEFSCTCFETLTLTYLLLVRGVRSTMSWL